MRSEILVLKNTIFCTKYKFFVFQSWQVCSQLDCTKLDTASKPSTCRSSCMGSICVGVYMFLHQSLSQPPIMHVYLLQKKNCFFKIVKVYLKIIWFKLLMALSMMYVYVHMLLHMDLHTVHDWGQTYFVLFWSILNDAFSTSIYLNCEACWICNVKVGQKI